MIKFIFLLSGELLKIIIRSFYIGNPSRGPFRRPSTLGWQQRVSLGALQRCLRSRRLHHIRCLRPNDSMRPRIFEIPLVQHQVRYSGSVNFFLFFRILQCAIFVNIILVF